VVVARGTYLKVDGATQRTVAAKRWWTQKVKTQNQIIRHALAGADGRTKVEGRAARIPGAPFRDHGDDTNANRPGGSVVAGLCAAT
jgi:hypothetical protein